MKSPQNWLLPALLAAGQLAVWPGLLGWVEPATVAAVWSQDAATPSPPIVVAAIGLTILGAVALSWRRRAPVAALVAVLVVGTVASLLVPDAALVLIGLAGLI